MPTISVDNPLSLLRQADRPSASASRPVVTVVSAHEQIEGAGFRIWRPFLGELPLETADPFLLLDPMGPAVNGPNETKGAPWHPHRGIETVTYMLDGRSHARQHRWGRCHW